MKEELKEVDWGRRYLPMIIGVNSHLILRRKNWGFRLIYDVYQESESIEELLGTCHVLERVCPNGSKFVVKELTSKSPQLAKRMEDIQQLIQTCF